MRRMMFVPAVLLALGCLLTHAAGSATWEWSGDLDTDGDFERITIRWNQTSVSVLDEHGRLLAEAADAVGTAIVGKTGVGADPRSREHHQPVGPRDPVDALRQPDPVRLPACLAPSVRHTASPPMRTPVAILYPESLRRYSIPVTPSTRKPC